MNRSLLTIALACLAILIWAPPLAAVVGIPWVGQIDFAAPEEASLLMRPDGAGAPFAAARLAGGQITDATVGVLLTDEEGFPVANFPFEDLWLQFAVDPGTAGGCFASPVFPGGTFMADQNTDAYGWTVWAAPLRGGGWSEGPVTVYLNGAPAMDPDQVVHPPVPLRVNSPDIDGDLQIDLTDIVLFAQSLGDYHYRADYDWNGVVDLTDIVIFAQAIGATCQ